MKLILFTASFPYIQGGETSFLNIEVQHLSRAFDRMIVVPETIKEAIPVEYPAIEVDNSYAEAMASKSKVDLMLLAFSSRLFRQGFMEMDFPRFSLTAWRRLIAFSGKAELTRHWLIDWMLRQNLDPQDCLFYTYWFDHATAGIGSAKDQLPSLKVVSRAHGYDIYEEHYYDPPFWPCRRTVLKTTDRIFADSYAGTEYLNSNYPEFASIFETSLLGVRDPGVITKPSADRVFQIVSCSRIGVEKRVDLILEGIISAARQRPHQRFEWHHFGNGDKREQLQKQVNETFPPNAKGFLPGFSGSLPLIDFYKNNPIDVFVNTSFTEGTSVAIMEAISFGIPVIATRVGGNMEIVSEQNGLLIPENSSPEDIAFAFFEFIDDVAASHAKRIGSRQKWSEEYNADANFIEFARELVSIRSGKKG